MIQRPHLLRRIEAALEANPVAALLGPRQCGKTTLAKLVAAGRACEYFDLENPEHLSQLTAPMAALKDLSGLVILDEVQRQPKLFEIIRVLVDRDGFAAKFLLLGSASPWLVRGVSESLAGRVAFVDMGGFDLREVGPDPFRSLWLRGGFPRSFLSASDDDSRRWRRDYVRTLLEREIPQLGIAIPAETLRRFWTMIAHYHGQVWNAADFARSLGRSENTMRRYLDILTGAYVVRQLQPWYENVGKRQVKSPKVYVRDTGILHALLSIHSMRDLLGNPKSGHSWEGFALEQVLSVSGVEDPHFWATHGGAEIDLLAFRHGRRIGFEFKLTDAPRTTRSIHVAMQDLGLEKVYVVYPGDRSFPMAENVQALAIRDLGTVA